MFYVIVAGSREFNDYNLLKEKLDYLLHKRVAAGETITIISGTANGADRLGERYAKEKGHLIRRIPADWNHYGNGAGYRRNVEMANIANALVAFWDGESPGTKHMIDIAEDKDLLTRVIYYKKESNSIKVGNIRTHKKDNSIAIKVDRTSVLGNPFYMANENERDLVCNQYEVYFKDKMEKKTDIAFVNEVNRIMELSKENDITLLCWCYPKRCHAETIIRYIKENRGD